MNIKGKKQNNLRLKATRKHWDWDEFKHVYEKQGRFVHRIERHLAKQDLQKQLKNNF